jgi:DNA-binding HxlR family transcriptional regulator
MDVSKLRGLPFDEKCPSRNVLRLVGDRWSLLIILQLEQGTRRFLELRRAIGGISPKVLAETLRKLEEHGLIERRVYDESPPRVDYRLTDLGQELAKVVVELDLWIGRNLARVVRAKAEFVRDAKSRVPWQVPRVA